MYLVARLARSHVTVALSGDGGDELFGGYDRYHRALGLSRQIDRVPRWARAGLARTLTSVPTRWWDGLRVVPSNRRPDDVGHKVHRLAGMVSLPDLRFRYDELTAHSPHGAAAPVSGSLDQGALRWMMLSDVGSYLYEDVLAKVDRTTMAVSLEARAPLLDHRDRGVGVSRPLEPTVGPPPGKHLLRKVLARHVPVVLFEQPKMGFGVPIGAWLGDRSEAGLTPCWTASASTPRGC